MNKFSNSKNFLSSKKAKRCILALMLLGMFRFSFADFPSGIFKWQNSHLAITASSPPALIYVEDGQGRKTGADPSLQINSNGLQNSAFGINEIPLSFAEPTNLDIGDVDGQSPHAQSKTLWTIHIFDGGQQTYTINLNGMVAGIVKINAIGLVKTGRGVPIVFNVLINQGQSRQVSLTFNPTSMQLNEQPIVGNSDLLSDIKVACGLNLINPHVCEHLINEATAIQEAINNNRAKEAIRMLKDFLDSLGGYSDGYNGENYQVGNQDSALSALGDDAKALLFELENGRGKGY